MSFKLVNYNEVPPGGFRYLQPETKVWVEAPSWAELLVAVKKHRLANNLPIGLQFDQEVETQLCERMPPEICARQGEKSFRRSSLSLDEFLTGTKILVKWFFTGGKKVDQAEADRRANICGSCHHNDNYDGCTSCNSSKVHEIVNQIVDGNKTKFDSSLKGCMICGCSNKAAVWLPLDILQNNTPDEVNAHFPEWCWKKKAT